MALDDAFDLEIASNDQHLVELQELSHIIGWPETLEEFELEMEIWTIYFLREKSSGKIVAKLTTADQTAFIAVGSAATHPDYQRRGLSTLLFHQIFRKEREEGKKRPFVLSSSPAGARLYKKLGFQQIGQCTRLGLSPNESIDKIDVQAFARRLGVSFRLLCGEEEDLSEISALAKEATEANYADYYRVFLSPRKGQEHRKPAVFVLEKNSKIIAFGGTLHILGMLFLGPIMSPDAELAELLIRLLIDDRDTHFPGLQVIIDVNELLLPKDSDWISRLHSMGLKSSPGTPLFQYNHGAQATESQSIFEAYSQGRNLEYVMHNPVIM